VLVGHYAPALLLRARASAGLPLWALFLAVQAVDVGFFLLGFAGVEAARITPGGRPVLEVTSGVYTHSLPSAVALGLSCVVAGAALGRARAGVLIGVAVASHWLLDLVVHVPDLPLGLTQQPAVGLGLWRYPPWSLLLELALLTGSWAVLRPRLMDGARRAGDQLVLALVVLQLLSDYVVPTPTTMTALGASALGLYAGCCALAWRVDRAEERGRSA
jgi:hypothetical protein